MPFVLRARLAGYAAAILCVVGAVSSAVHSQSCPQPTTKPATTQPAARSLHISLVDAQTGRPIAGVHGSYMTDNRDYKEFDFNEKGQYAIPLKTETRSLYFSYHKDGYIVNMVDFGRSPSSTPIPDSYTVRMQRGIRIGGIVQDESGKGVDGASIQLDFRSPTQHALGYGSAKTDPDGRWIYDGAPDNPSSFRIYASHPDYIMSSFGHDFEGPQFPELRKMRLAVTIRRGLSVSGFVHDESGKPIAGASVTPDQFGVRSATTNGADGHFILRGSPPDSGRSKPSPMDLLRTS